MPELCDSKYSEFELVCNTFCRLFKKQRTTSLCLGLFRLCKPKAGAGLLCPEALLERTYKLNLEHTLTCLLAKPVIYGFVVPIKSIVAYVGGFKGEINITLFKHERHKNTVIHRALPSYAFLKHPTTFLEPSIKATTYPMGLLQELEIDGV